MTTNNNRGSGSGRGGKRVAVIGAGTSGLCSVKTCLEYGLQPTCFEQHGKLGGVWYYSHSLRYNQGSASYKNLTLNTPSNSTAFSDFPFTSEAAVGETDNVPLFCPQQVYWEYLDKYSDHFALRKHIRFQTEVTRVQRDQHTDKWYVHYRRVVSQSEAATENNDGESSVEMFDYVIVCCGINKKAKLPFFEGQEKFKGQILHSNQFREAAHFQDKKVVVIGAGNSAGDVACEIAHLNSRPVHLSARNGIWLVQRYIHPGSISLIAKLAVKFSGYLEVIFPVWLMDFLSTKLVNSLIDHKGFGLNPKTSFSHANSLMTSDHMVPLLGSGRIKLVPDISHLSEHDVHLSNGDVIKDVDCVICATGYECDFSMVDCSVFGGPSFKETRLYKYVFPISPQPPTLAVVCMYSGKGGIPPVFELQARWAVSVFTGQSCLPSVRIMEQSFERDRKWSISAYGAEKLQRPYIPYCDFMASQIGCYPGVFPLLWKYRSVSLVWRVWFATHTPWQYRLVGPHSWEGAYGMCIERLNSVAFPEPS